MNYDIAQIKYKLKKYGQEHLLNFYDTLDENKKEELLKQINEIDFELINSLYSKTKESTKNENVEFNTYFEGGGQFYRQK